MSDRLFNEAGTLRDHPVFWNVQQSLFCGSCMSSSSSIPSSSPCKSSFLPKWQANFIRSLLDAYHSLEVIGASRSRHWSIPERILGTEDTPLEACFLLGKTGFWPKNILCLDYWQMHGIQIGQAGYKKKTTKPCQDRERQFWKFFLPLKMVCQLH